ncbi:MAG: glutamine synthetase III [Candidatus Caccovivens sp.]
MKNNCGEFAKFLLTDDKLKKFMKRKNFERFMKLKKAHKEMEEDLADSVADAIKKWALSLGTTHYTHWFFPLTGNSAEKQVSFLDFGDNGEFINKFNGKALIKGEADASSFPSGGERMTFEARGYTVWDYTSPVFIKEDNNGNRVLYIPTAFCAFTGVALDEKTPLLRAIEVLSNEATKTLKFLGHDEVKNVFCNVGSEQEYFLIDKKLFDKRLDLKLVGRTLLGAEAIKGQESEHHYYCPINSRVSAFMHDLDKELWAEGIMAKVQHNEVAPSQHEIVPIYSSVNIASDQNALTMEIMAKVADRHGLKVLFHEKPFANVNGSGKHNNWSLETDTGINLLDYNSASEDVFMLFFTVILSAIDKHYDLLRLSTSTLSNDMRLGGHEAPPSVISVYIGEDLAEVLKNYEKKEKIDKKGKTLLDLKTSSVATLYKDNCDRNRTSPFAYTGNKFEFRMVGSAQSTALCNAILALIIADELKIVNKELENGFDIKKIISENIKKHSRIIFNGNSYDKSWKDEAKRRGLVDFKNSVDCYERLINEDNITLFEDNKVLTRAEILVRYDTYMKAYFEGVLTEAKTMLCMMEKECLPAICATLTEKMNLLSMIKAEKFEKSAVLSSCKRFVNIIESINNAICTLKSDLENISKKITAKEKAMFARDVILQDMNTLREYFDSIEREIPKENTPFPSYDELLY